MTDTEVLQECRMATWEEKAITKQIDRLALMAGPRDIGSQALAPAGDRKTNNPQSGQMQKLEGLIEKLARMREENISIICRAETVIERVKDRKHRSIVRYYYIEGWSDYEIAREIEMSPQWVQQQRNKTLDQLATRKI